MRSGDPECRDMCETGHGRRAGPESRPSHHSLRSHRRSATIVPAPAGHRYAAANGPKCATAAGRSNSRFSVGVQPPPPAPPPRAATRSLKAPRLIPCHSVQAAAPRPAPITPQAAAAAPRCRAAVPPPSCPATAAAPLLPPHPPPPNPQSRSVTAQTQVTTGTRHGGRDVRPCVR